MLRTKVAFCWKTIFRKIKSDGKTARGRPRVYADGLMYLRAKL